MKLFLLSDYKPGILFSVFFSDVPHTANERVQEIEKNKKRIVFKEDKRNVKEDEKKCAHIINVRQPF